MGAQNAAKAGYMVRHTVMHSSEVVRVSFYQKNVPFMKIDLNDLAGALCVGGNQKIFFHNG
jgi:hypothetical protein